MRRKRSSATSHCPNGLPSRIVRIRRPAAKSSASFTLFAQQFDNKMVKYTLLYSSFESNQNQLNIFNFRGNSVAPCKIICSVSGDWHDEGFVQFFYYFLGPQHVSVHARPIRLPFFFLSWTFSHVGWVFWSERNKNEGWDLGH